jgi:hypothetical protein
MDRTWRLSTDRFSINTVKNSQLGSGSNIEFGSMLLSDAKLS